MIYVPSRFQQKINVEYPPNNKILFEEWVISQAPFNTAREFLAINWTGYYVNNNYGNDREAMSALQVFLDDLPTDKKYWTVVQYDYSILNNVSHLDLLQFNMSKNIGVGMPLLCQPHPYQFPYEKKYEANFIGSKTHPIRNFAEELRKHSGYYISYDPHNIETYCRILSESQFTLCFRGYGQNSFRIAEAMQYGSIPVYISDTFVDCFDANFEDYGVLIHEIDAHMIDDILKAIPLYEVMMKQDRLREYYEKYYTYTGALTQILKRLAS